MKKYCMLLGMLLVLKVNAQERKKKIVEFTLGPTVGMNSYGIKTNLDYKDQIVGSGFSGGVFMRLKVLKVYAQPEFFYHFSSATLTGTETNSSYYYRLKIQSTQLNGIVGARIIGVKNLFYLRAFAGAGHVDNIKKKFELNDVIYPTGTLKDKYYHGIAGVGLDILPFTIDARYEFSFDNIMESTTTSIEDRMLILTLGYKIKTF